jgi:aarF domain-containing kinase
MFLPRISSPAFRLIESEAALALLQNPLLIQARHHSSVCYFKSVAPPPSLPLERWSNNFARLYARRILEMAAASASTLKAQTKLQEAITKPDNWVNWERRDWTEDMLASLGTSRLGRLWLSLSRIASLSILATPLVILTPFSYVSQQAHQYMWDYALYAIEQAGPTFIKFIQWATTRQDLFSQEFCNHFGKLRDQTRGHGWADTERLLVSELGPNWASVLQLDRDPIGSGCIAQVYKGTLKQKSPHHPEGSEIAIKVQHPGIWQKVCVDFYILGKIANALEAIPYLNLDYLSIRDTVDQFCNVMLPQLDLTLESKHLTRFNKDFGSDPQITFPVPLDELTTQKILVETFCHGSPILQFQSADLETRKELAYLGLQTTLKMIFLNDFVSAPPFNYDKILKVLTTICGFSFLASW